MARMRKGPEAHDDASSLTDLMAGIAAIFLLIAVIFILTASTRQEREAAERKRFEGQISELRQFRQRVLKSLDELHDALAADKELMELVSMDDEARRRDPFLFLIVFNRNRLSFPRGECDLRAEQVPMVVSAAPRVLGHVCEFVQKMESSSSQGDKATITMTLEGHTDHKPFIPGSPGCGVDRITCLNGRGETECQQVGFENNVRLSAARAQSVFFLMQRAVSGNSELSSCLEKYFVVAGRGPVEPLDSRPWNSDRSESAAEQNRRVVLKIRAQPSMETASLVDEKPAGSP
jgi:flagellar motor protein MotB